jgi:hypothetical protein
MVPHVELLGLLRTWTSTQTWSGLNCLKPLLPNTLLYVLHVMAQLVRNNVFLACSLLQLPCIMRLQVCTD